jgi:hypothetical protein
VPVEADEFAGTVLPWSPLLLHDSKSRRGRFMLPLPMGFDRVKGVSRSVTPLYCPESTRLIENSFCQENMKIVAKLENVIAAPVFNRGAR